MKRLLFIVLFVTVASSNAIAQQQGGRRLSPAEFAAKMEAEITQKVGLTADEGKRLFPIFHEMKAKQHELMKQLGRLKKPECGLSDKDAKERVMQIKRLQSKLAELEETYYKKMCDAIPASKVYLVMMEEDRFHREMLSRFNHDKRPKPHHD